MKKIFALLLAVLMLASLTACGGDADRIAQLESENAALKAQVAELTAELALQKQPAGLSDWHFEATAWEGSNGATVTFSAVPASYEEGQTAALGIWLEGDPVDTVPCLWNGNAYTAVTDLNAVDGYCYYLTLTSADGKSVEVELNTPKNPTYPAVIDLETSLAAYCAMMVEDALVEDGKLTVSAGYAQVQLPAISRTGSGVSVTGAELVMKVDGSEISRQALTLTPETEQSLIGEIIGLSFQIPQMEDDQQLELWLEVALSDGQILFTTGGCWYFSGGELFLVVG